MLKEKDFDVLIVDGVAGNDHGINLVAILVNIQHHKYKKFPLLFIPPY
jgi:hypothetical protein